MDFEALCKEITRLIKKGDRQSLLQADKLIKQAVRKDAAQNDAATLTYVTHLRLRLLARQGRLGGLMEAFDLVGATFESGGRNEWLLENTVHWWAAARRLGEDQKADELYAQLLAVFSLLPITLQLKIQLARKVRAAARFVY